VTTGKVIRALVGLTVLVILLAMVNGWWADYKNATPKSGSAEATSTAVATETAPSAATGRTVLVLTDGLNFREKPDATGASIRGLKKGETFVLVSQSGGWLKLSDASGQIGWVNNNPQYVRIEKK
jgi:SH3-like domain-containing protein